MGRWSAITSGWLVLTSAACMQVPDRPEEPTALDPDGSLGVGLSADGGWLRPPTGEPYAGPECELGAPGAGSGAARASSTDAAGGSGAPLAAGAGADPPVQPGAPDAAARMPRAAGELVITELMANPEAVRDDAGEWFELYNPSADATLDLDGCALLDGGSAARSVMGALRIAPGGFAVVARSEQVGFTPDRVMSFSLANTADSLALVCGGVEIDQVAYGAGFPLAAGASLSLDPAAHDAAANDVASAWCAAQLSYSGGDRGTPGALNADCNAEAADAGSE